MQPKPELINQSEIKYKPNKEKNNSNQNEIKAKPN